MPIPTMRADTANVETPPGATSTAAHHRRIDLLLASGICLLALGFWFWDEQPNPVTPAQPVAAAEPTVAAQPTVTAQSAAATQQRQEDAFNASGMQLYAASNFRGAEAQFRQAVSVRPGDALAYCNLGAALIAEHRYDDAIAALQKALVLNPALALARNNLNWALAEKKKSRG